MPKQKIKRTVQELAKDAKIDLEDMLLLLWDNGFDKIKDQNDVLIGTDLKRAQRLFKLPLPQEIISTEYWCKILDLPRNEFLKYLSELGFECSNNAKRIPQGSLRILKRVSQPTQTLIEETRYISKPQTISPKKQVKNNFVWRIIGREADIEFLSCEDVLHIHNTLVQDFATLDDPISPSGISCKDLLDSAIFRPKTSLGEVFKYPTVQMSAGAMLHSLIHNHAFFNGNKRTALVSMLVFLDKNGFVLTCSEDVLFKFVLQLAQHMIIERNHFPFEDAETLATIEWIDRNSRAIENWDRPLQFRKLRKILTEYNCEFERPKASGSSINIERVVIHKGKLWRKERTEILKTQIYHGDEGEEVERNTINKIRRHLKLDEANGIDSKAFYETAPSTVDDFILIYRKTLDKLARM